MTDNDVLSIFFSRIYENQLNNKVLEDIDYHVDEYGLLNYVANVIAVPYNQFINFIITNPCNEPITSFNITQSSSFEACECEMIDIFLSEDNRGMDFVEIGKHFTKYIRSDKDGAFRKYGENQVKTSYQLGLAFEYFNHWYMNCTGYIYNKLDSDDKASLMARNILRDPLYRKMMIDLTSHDIDIVSYMGCLDSNETKLRRYDNVKALLMICLKECQKEGVAIHTVINTKAALSNLVKQEKTSKQKKSIKKTDPQIGNYDLGNTESINIAADESEIVF